MLIKKSVVFVGQRIDGDDFDRSRRANRADHGLRAGADIEDSRHGLAVGIGDEIGREAVLIRHPQVHVRDPIGVGIGPVNDPAPEVDLGWKSSLPLIACNHEIMAIGIDRFRFELLHFAQKLVSLLDESPDRRNLPRNGLGRFSEHVPLQIAVRPLMQMQNVRCEFVLESPAV